MALAEAEGYELTKEEAESFLAELSDVELGDETLEKAAGGHIPPGRLPGKGMTILVQKK